MLRRGYHADWLILHPTDKTQIGQYLVAVWDGMLGKKWTRLQSRVITSGWGYLNQSTHHIFGFPSVILAKNRFLSERKSSNCCIHTWILGLFYEQLKYSSTPSAPRSTQKSKPLWNKFDLHILKNKHYEICCWCSQLMVEKSVTSNNN